MILLVEDEPGILDFMERGLRRQGFEVTGVADGATGYERALELDVELVVLDMMLPALSGETVLRRLHERRPELPVIILTARDEVADRVAALDAGAVDYLVKPITLDELAARVRAQIRSARRGETTLSAGGIRVDLISRRLSVGEQEVRLSNTEFELLVYLMRSGGTVLSREQILRAVWNYHHDPGTNVLEVYIGYLRRKLAATGVAPIRTIRSRGYRFDGGSS